MMIKMMSRYVRSMLLLLVMTTLCVSSYADQSEESAVPTKRVLLDKVIAVVGGASILLSDIDETAAAIDAKYRRQGYTPERSVRDEALEELLMQKLLYTQGMIDSVDVSQSQVAMRVEEYVESMSAAAGGLKELEAEHNMGIFNIREVLRRRIEEQSFASAMRSSVVDKVTIVPGEVEQYYKSKDRDSLPLIGEQLRYAQITRLPGNVEEAKRRVRERLLGMREQIINGESRFSSLARMYSVDPGSAYRGGEMEPQPSTAFVAEFADALESLQPGQVSEVVETQFGFHIIELIDQVGNLYHCRHILLRPEYTTDELMEPINSLDSLVNLIRKDSLTFEKAAYDFSDDASSKMNGGIVSNHDILERYNASDASLTVTKFLKEDFGQMGYKSLDDYNELMKLQKGEVSNAFTTEDMLGNPISKVVKLVEVYPAHEASMADDYLRLEDLALAAKKEEVFEKWLTRHIASTYIFIDPDYRDAEFENPGWVK